MDTRPTITHGGGLIAAQARYPGAPTPWLDLSTGINPVPYPIPSLPPDAWHRLPEPEDVRRLEAAAARAYGVADPAMVVAAPGTQVLISLLPHVLCAGRVTVLGPTYAEHAAAWSASGSTVTTVPNLAGLRGASTAVLCNPNNPDGRRVEADVLAVLAAGCGRLVVDEAFADLEAPGCSLAPALPRNAIVLRSFGKTYGLAGLRLGFAVAPPDVAQAIRTALGPWAVGGPAVAIGIAALGDSAWLTAARARLLRDTARLDAMLEAAGLRVVGGTLLFRLAEAPGAVAMFDRLARAGILVRSFDDGPGWLRFGIPAEGWDRLRAALTATPSPSGRGLG